MASPVTQARLAAAIGWALARENDGFGDTTQGEDEASFDLDGLDVAVFNELMALKLEIAGGDSEDIDFTSFTNLVYQNTGFTKVLAIVLLPDGSDVELKPGGSNPLNWFFRGEDGITVHDGGVFVLSMAPDSEGEPVDATHKIMTVTAIKSATITVVGPYDAGNMPFAVGSKYTWLLNFTDSIGLSIGAVIESIEPDNDVEGNPIITIVAQSDGSFTAAIT